MISLFTLTGCLPETLGDTHIYNDVYVDVHEDCDEPTEQPANEPEEVPEVSDQLLEIGFTTAFHAAQPFLAQPDQEVILGSVTFHSPYGQQLNLMTIQISIGIDTDGDELYEFGDGALIRQYVQSCQLRGWPQIVDYSDPSPLTDEGNLVAILGQSVGEEGIRNADIVCQLTETVPEQQVGIMADLPIPAVANVFDQLGRSVQSVVTETNGNPPRVAALIGAEEEPIEPWDVGPVQHTYSNSLLPSQGLFDWYADEEYYLDPANGTPNPVLTADTLNWSDEGTMTAQTLEWTILVTSLDSPLPLDPTPFIEHCTVFETQEGSDNMFGLEEVETLTPVGDTLTLPFWMLTPMVWENTFSYTTRIACQLLPNTSGETVQVAVYLREVVNPALYETGQELDVNMQPHDLLQFYHLSE